MKIKYFTSLRGVVRHCERPKGAWQSRLVSFLGWTASPLHGLAMTMLGLSFFLFFVAPSAFADTFSVTGSGATMNTIGGSLHFSPDTNTSINLTTGKFNGYFWSQDVGWMSFSSVNLNLSTGIVTGQATVSNTGAVLDFTNYNSNVKINLTTGVFSGYAFSTDLGWVAFGTTDNASGPVSVNLTTGVVSGNAMVINTGATLGSTYLPNVTVNTSTQTFSGYAWEDNVGWIAFGTTDNPSGPVMFSVANGKLSGKATVLNTGAYLDFDNYNSNVYLNLNSGKLKGYVFSQDLGWINFNNTGVSSGPGFTMSQGQPIAYWKFDDAQGNIASDSGRFKYNGVLSGTTIPTWQTEDLCVAGKCLYFDGITSNVSVAALIPGVQSVSFWVKPATSSASLVGLSSGIDIYASNGTIGTDGITSPTIYVNANQNGKLKANVWNFITVNTSTPLSATSVTLGRMQRGVLNGFIDEVKLYPYARSAAQVKTDFNARGTAKGASVNVGTPPNSNLSALNQGLVGYWKMDDTLEPATLGEVKDSSGNGNNMAAGCYGTGCIIPTTGAGKFGNGGSFNGSQDQYVRLSGFSLTTTQVTLAAWVNPAVSQPNPVGGEVIIVSPYQGTNNMFLSWITNGQFRFRTSGSTNGTLATGANYPGNNWYHVVGTRDINGIRKLYVNGVLAATDNGGTSPAYWNNSITNMMIGEYYPGSSNGYLSGAVDEVRIYNRALSPSDVQNLYNYAPGPVAQYKLEEGSGTSANDTSGYGHNATVNNGTWVNGKVGKGVKLNGNSGSDISVPDF